MARKRKKNQRKISIKDPTGKIHDFHSHLEEAFFYYWTENYPTTLFSTQYVFASSKNYSFDFAWPNRKVALEIQGYGPGHSSRLGTKRDVEKHNLALTLQWKVVYLVSEHLKEENIHESCKTLRKLLGIFDADRQRGPRPYIPASHRKRGRAH